MDNRNLILAIVLSIAILFGFEMLFPSKPVPQAPQQTTEQAAQGTEPHPDSTTPTAPQTDQSATPSAAPQSGGTAAAPSKTVEQVIKETPRISITSPSLTGSLSLKGGRIDDLILNKYSETLDKDSPKIRLLRPRGVKDAYYAEYGWIAAGDVKVPGNSTVWRADKTVLSPASPVTLSWDNGQGLTFKRVISLDKDYMFTVTQQVENHSGQAVSLHPYALVSRWGTPEVLGRYILHEGPLGVIDGSLKEVKYSTLQDDGQDNYQTTGGWIGFTDKYWLTALIPDQKDAIHARMLYTKGSPVEKYQTDFVGTKHDVAPNATAETTTKFFAGAKRVKLRDTYAERDGVPNFDKAVDFGMFYFLTKPIFDALHWLHSIVGNFGVAILLLTLGIKAIMFPLANKSYVSMSKMKMLQPEIKKLQERFADDKVRLNQEMMALYKKEKANPAAGCLPVVVQIPVFFSLYKVLMVTIEMRHAPFFGWVHDLSAKDPTSLWNLFGLIPWDHAAYVPSALDIGVWPIVMGLTMWLQQKLNPQPTDAMQAKIFRFLPFIFTFMLGRFSVGLVIYWAWNNTLSIAQQWLIMRRMGVKAGD